MVVCKSEAKGSVSEAGGNEGYREYIYIKVRLVVGILTITKPIKKKTIAVHGQKSPSSVFAFGDCWPVTLQAISAGFSHVYANFIVLFTCSKEMGINT